MRERHTRQRALLWIVLSLAACEGAKGADADKVLFERGLLAAERGAYEQALLLRARLSPQSSYYRQALGEPRYLHAAKVYRVRARARIEALIGTGRCDAAQQALRGALHLVRHWRTMEARLRDCRKALGGPASLPSADAPTAKERLAKRVLEAYVDDDFKRAFALGERYLVETKDPENERILTVVAASACKLGRHEMARKIGPRLSLPRLAMLNRACATPPTTQPTSTSSDAKCDPKVGSQAVIAYLQLNWQRALTLGQQYLLSYPTDQKVLAIVGASACKLGRVEIAKEVYARLQPARRSMLKQVCAPSKIVWPAVR